MKTAHWTPSDDFNWYAVDIVKFLYRPNGTLMAIIQPWKPHAFERDLYEVPLQELSYISEKEIVG